MDKAREIVDYAETDNAIEMRNALYSALHDRVRAHIETHKVEVAKQLMNPDDAATEDEVAHADEPATTETE
jgi:hypothetical protein